MFCLQTNADSRVLTAIQQTVLPNLVKILEGQEKQQATSTLIVSSSKWDDADASPSPPRKPNAHAATTISIPLPPPPKSTPSR